MICIVWAMLIKCWWMIYLINSSLQYQQYFPFVSLKSFSGWAESAAIRNQILFPITPIISRGRGRGSRLQQKRQLNWISNISKIYLLIELHTFNWISANFGFVGKFLKSLNSSIRNMVRRWGHGSNFRKIGRTAQNPLWVWTDTAHTRCGTYHLI